jgi:hypothetical protein
MLKHWDLDEVKFKLMSTSSLKMNCCEEWNRMEQKFVLAHHYISSRGKKDKQRSLPLMKVILLRGSSHKKIQYIQLVALSVFVYIYSTLNSTLSLLFTSLCSRQLPFPLRSRLLLISFKCILVKRQNLEKRLFPIMTSNADYYLMLFL